MNHSMLPYTPYGHPICAVCDLDGIALDVIRQCPGHRVFVCPTAHNLHVAGICTLTFATRREAEDHWTAAHAAQPLRAFVPTIRY